MARKPTTRELFDTLTAQVVNITTAQQEQLQLLTSNLQALDSQIQTLQSQAIKQHENIVDLSAQVDALGALTPKARARIMR
jgi:uncharacterized coiled-coil protein SlyX